MHNYRDNISIDTGCAARYALEAFDWLTNSSFSVVAVEHAKSDVGQNASKVQKHSGCCHFVWRLASDHPCKTKAGRDS